MEVQQKSHSNQPGLKLLLIAILISFGGAFHFGYQITATNPCHEIFLQFLNTSIISNYQKSFELKYLEAIWSVIIAILFVGAIFGSLVLRKVADKFGRKWGLFLSNSITLVALLMAILAKFILSIELYAISRFIIGFSITLSLGLAVIFLTESSPKYCRGSIGMTTGVIVQLGMVFGSLLSIPIIFGTLDKWWLIYAFEVFIFCIVLLILPFVYESPSYLILCGKDDEAKKSIKFFYSCPKSDVEGYYLEIKENVKLNTKSYGLFEIWRSSNSNSSKFKTDRRGTIVGCVVMFAMSFSGIAAINSFAVTIIRSTNLTQLTASLANVGLSTLSLCGGIFSYFSIDKFGRRRLLLITLTIIFISNIFIVGLLLIHENYSLNWVGICLIISISVFMLAFATGPGPLCYFVSAEMVSQNARSAAQSYTSLVQMISRALILMIFLPLKNLTSNSWSYLILFVGPVLFSLIFLYFRLPETKNRNLKEVEKEIEKLPKINLKWFKKSKKSSKLTQNMNLSKIEELKIDNDVNKVLDMRL